ncbi:MAG: hypothetical protein AAF513_07500 [Pseudomonadota bacterium]
MLIGSRRGESGYATWQKWWDRLCRPERLGQTLASLFWIASAMSYGIATTGDWLQLCAASAWFVSNVYAVVAADDVI